MSVPMRVTVTTGAVSVVLDPVVSVPAVSVPALSVPPVLTGPGPVPSVAPGVGDTGADPPGATSISPPDGGGGGGTGADGAFDGVSVASVVTAPGAACTPVPSVIAGAVGVGDSVAITVCASEATTAAAPASVGVCAWAVMANVPVASVTTATAVSDRRMCFMNSLLRGYELRRAVRIRAARVTRGRPYGTP